jgi:hypothetical protein
LRDGIAGTYDWFRLSEESRKRDAEAGEQRS